MIFDAARVMIPFVTAFVIGIAIAPVITHYLYKHRAWKKKGGKTGMGDALIATSLEYGTTTEKWSDTLDEGIVIGSKPEAGTTLRPDAAVDLIVSKGPEPIKVKDWVGKDADDARAWFEDRGLDVEITGEEFSDTVDEGDVISQDPPGGSTSYRGDEVSLVVSKGPELVEVPSVRGQGVDVATETLEDLGFDVETREATGSLGLGYVFSQTPGGGDLARKGSTIVLTLI